MMQTITAAEYQRAMQHPNRERRKKGQPEFKLQCVIADWFRHNLDPVQVRWTAGAEGEHRAKKTAKRLKRIGVQPGEPDFRLYHKGRVYFIELKAPEERDMFGVVSRKGYLSATQKEVLAWFEQNDFRVCVARSLDEVIHALESWGVPLKGGVV